MSNDWINDYLDSTKDIREHYNNTRAKFGWSIDISHNVKWNGKRYYAFVANDELRLFVGAPVTWKKVNGRIPDWNHRVIPLDEIRYFARDGELHTETRISGGETKPNIKGAIIGGLIAGSVGALIGGQNIQTAVHGETSVSDNRHTLLVCNNATLIFDYDDYHVFVQLLPTKELSSLLHQPEREQYREAPSNIEDRLKSITDLHDKGLITDLEFEAKRKELIALL